MFNNGDAHLQTITIWPREFQICGYFGPPA